MGGRAIQFGVRQCWQKNPVKDPSEEEKDDGGKRGADSADRRMPSRTLAKRKKNAVEDSSEEEEEDDGGEGGGQRRQKNAVEDSSEEEEEDDGGEGGGQRRQKNAVEDSSEEEEDGNNEEEAHKVSSWVIANRIPFNGKPGRCRSSTVGSGLRVTSLQLTPGGPRSAEPIDSGSRSYSTRSRASVLIGLSNSWVTLNPEDSPLAQGCATFHSKEILVNAT
ncbi:uncharacterized protein B0J16DRAFT_315385 [Fusarium flagelliforme]|uniref:uncharacterized protein n=1 Tax=Fusarium flagelliforme TaxID=2675880 RepID=UPI001E8D0A82|nr:uncharacterized protein B0J16DRAFT_315385 [Fusarium flagelliforme]KAH7199112.1 hypothetical protein B0J16DRAFT_315385 [Fusarium flagelliforme]